ncbi:thioesterase family protein [Nocardioides seonyuensis]|uniref:thioesterase family protein n=1 Tax=Nocardioides seonyuensis TaxID=2518371 RepID=UPI001422D2C5|nr:thioesterase family protein [Nocardioides seonyuensis]
MQPLLPSPEAVLALPALMQGRVLSSDLDLDGHMSMQRHVERGEEGAEMLLRSVGVDDAYRAEQGMAVFSAEHHVRLFRELSEGGQFSVHTMLLDRSARIAHLLAFLLDHEEHSISSTVEMVLVHVGMATRRAVDFPAEVATGLDALIATSQRFDGRVPTSGSMGIRR